MNLFQVVFEHDCISPIPIVQHRSDGELNIKFKFVDSVPVVGDMIALFDADQLACNGGNLSSPKAVAMVPLEGYNGYYSVTFQRKN